VKQLLQLRRTHLAKMFMTPWRVVQVVMATSDPDLSLRTHPHHQSQH